MHNAETTMNGAVRPPCGCSSSSGCARLARCAIRRCSAPLFIVHRALCIASGRERASRVRLRARWVLPIVSPPIHDGWVDILDGRISGLGQGSGEEEEGRRATWACGADARARERAHAPRAVVSGRHRSSGVPLHGILDSSRPMASRRAQPDPLAVPILDAASESAIVGAPCLRGQPPWATSATRW